MTDAEIEKIVKKIREAKISLNKISKATGLSNSTLKNYIEGRTKPTKANFSILEAYFSEKIGDFSQNSGSVVIGKNNNGNIDNRQYYSDSPDVLRAQIDILDERIKEKDAQIKEKDAQIKDLHEIIKQLSQK